MAARKRSRRAVWGVLAVTGVLVGVAVYAYYAERPDWSYEREGFLPSPEHLITYGVTLGVERPGDLAEVFFQDGPRLLLTPKDRGWVGTFAFRAVGARRSSGRFVIGLPAGADVDCSTEGRGAGAPGCEDVLRIPDQSQATILLLRAAGSDQPGAEVETTVRLRWDDPSAKRDLGAGRELFLLTLSNNRLVEKGQVSAFPAFTSTAVDPNGEPAPARPEVGLHPGRDENVRVTATGGTPVARTAYNVVVVPWLTDRRTPRYVEALFEDQATLYRLDALKDASYVAIGCLLSLVGIWLDLYGRDDADPPDPAVQKSAHDALSEGMGPGEDLVWDRIRGAQGQTFTTIRGRPFTYELRNESLRISRTGRGVSRADVMAGLARMPTERPSNLEQRHGSYTWAILMDPRIRQSDW